MIAYGVKENAVIGCPLVAVVDYVFVKLPALHDALNNDVTPSAKVGIIYYINKMKRFIFCRAL